MYLSIHPCDIEKQMEQKTKKKKKESRCIKHKNLNLKDTSSIPVQGSKLQFSLQSHAKINFTKIIPAKTLVM